MIEIQKYFQKQIIWPFLLTLLAFISLALMSQGLSKFNLVIDQNQNLSVFLTIMALITPQLIVHILPVTLFVAILYAYNKLYTDRELIIARASGLSQWHLAIPAIRLAIIIAVLHLFINLWVQPSAYRILRQILYEIKTDVTVTLIKPGQFIHPEPGLTLFSNEVRSGGILKNILIHDIRKQEEPITFTAQSGVLSRIEGQPVITMYNGTIQRIEPNGGLSLLDFDSYTFDLNSLVLTEGLLIYKTSDRYIYELLYPDLKDPWQRKNKNALLSEGHYRLSSPLYDLSLSLIALGGLLLGRFKRRGYAGRITIAVTFAILVRIFGFYIQSVTEKYPDLNFLQYLSPIIIILFLGVFLFSSPLPALSRIFISRQHQPSGE